MDVKAVDERILQRIKSLRLPEVSGRNQYISLHVRGDGVRAPRTWNARVYRNSHGSLKLVTTDIGTLEKMLSGKAEDKKERKIQVDDSGWGFPLGGMLIGAFDGVRVETGLVDIKYFQGAAFAGKEYLEEASRVTLTLLKKLSASPDKAMVEICTGFVNTRSKEALRSAGYQVDVTEITGTLQDDLEKRFKEYIRSLGYEGRMSVQDSMRWIDEKPDERLKIAKTGWKTLSHKGQMIRPD